MVFNGSLFGNYVVGKAFCDSYRHYFGSVGLKLGISLDFCERRVEVGVDITHYGEICEGFNLRYVESQFRNLFEI